jgi:hypothetical protein
LRQAGDHWISAPPVSSREIVRHLPTEPLAVSAVPPVTSRDEYEAARARLLVKEKAHISRRVATEVATDPFGMSEKISRRTSREKPSQATASALNLM